MYAREIYGLMMAGAMLLIAGCSADDVVKETTSERAIAISFSCNYDDKEEGYITRAGHQGAMNTEDLYASGFGVMASVSAGSVPNLMYNQKVEFTFVGDMDPLKGYWSYSPLKYWPNSMTDFYISAYAPYVEPTDLENLPANETGIIGISENNEEPFITYRRCEKPGNVVDLLWYYATFENHTDIPDAGKLDMKMRHALARLEIKVALAAAPDPVTTKVLIEKITLTGEMTRTANLMLNNETVDGNNHYPIWQALETPDVENRTIQIMNEDNKTESYGVIDAQVRYIPGLPYSWQPAGLKVYDADPEAEDNGMRNALSTGDRTGYVYLIPQATLSLKINVKYHKVTSGGVDTVGEKSIDASPVTTPITISPLNGNTTYTLNVKLSDI